MKLTILTLAVALTLAAHSFCRADPLDTWSLPNPYSPNTNGLMSVCYGNDLFVTVGYTGTILTSSDGINWASRNAGTTLEFAAIAYGNGIFVANAIPPGNNIYISAVFTSTNGINWIQQLSGPLSNNMQLYAIAFVNELFIAVAWDYTARQYTILTSPDGNNWTRSNLSQDNLPVGIISSCVGYGNGLYVVMGCNLNAVGFILTSSDCVNWIQNRYSSRNCIL